MIPYDTIVLRPPTADSHGLQELAAELAARGIGRQDVLSLTYFVPPGDDFVDRREHARALARKLFGRTAPPVTVVAQTPVGGAPLALEVAVLSEPDVVIARRECGAVSYTSLRKGGIRQVHCGGIASDAAVSDTVAQSQEVFHSMRAVLTQEGLSFGNVVRQWGYIEGLLDVRADCPLGHQRYQAFNDVRALAYGPSRFPSGYPAATGIGQSAGGVALEFIAVEAPSDVRIAPLSNPRQTDAHCYSGRMLVGEAIERDQAKSTPKFERAKQIVTEDAETVFVSGTASIVGERSVGVGDVEAQTRTTIENISALVEGRGLSRLRAYLKRPQDFAAVRRICESAFGAIPALYVQADVCRDDLLVELEGDLRVRTHQAAERC